MIASNKSPMNYTSLKTFLLFMLFLVLVCCKNNTKVETSDNKKVNNIFKDEKPQVEVIDLKTGTFCKEILCNGKLYALKKADIRFRVSEVIEKINVTNGESVPSGTILATLENYTYSLRLKRSIVAYNKAKVDMQDVLIGQGYQSADSSSVPANVWKMASIKSGLENAKFDLESAQYDFQNSILKAPFAGTICNLKVKEHNLPGNEPFCTLVDNTTFEASFQILESEIGNVTPGMPVFVIPFASDSTAQPGVVSEVNPLVDENGLVTVKAKINNSHNRLYEGMNVRVVVRKIIPNRLVVPKTAVVLRTGKEVVFTFENGHAIWNYVKTGDENTTSFTIIDGLKPGMKVITSNNLNLGHDAEVGEKGQGNGQ